MKFGKKKKSAETQAPEAAAKKPSASGNPVKEEAKKTFIKTLMQIIGATVAMAGALYYVLVLAANNNIQDVITEELAKTQANAVSAQVSFLSKQMDEIAASTAIVSALDKRNYPEAHLLAEEIQTDLPSAHKVYIIPAGLADDFILNFSELNMVRKIERKEAFIPEAVERDGVWYINMAVPIMSNLSFQTVAGTLFISFNIDFLAQNLQALDSETAVVTLIQQFPGGEARNVFTTEPANKSKGITVDVENSNWKISLAPARNLRKISIVSPLMLGAILFTYILVLFALLQMLYKQLSTKLRTEVAPIQIASAKTISKSEKSDKTTEEYAEEERKRAIEKANASIASPMFQHNDMLDVPEVEDQQDEEFEDLSELVNLEDDALGEEIASDDIFSMEEMAENAALLEGKPAAATIETRAPEAPTPAVNTAVSPSQQGRSINPTIFRDYDIRGNADRFIGNDDAYAIGQAIGSEALSKGENIIAVGGDGRTSTPRIKEHLIKGIISTGCDVEDLGKITTPVMYFATTTTTTMSGVMVTASHNPAEDNGFKIVICGRTLASQDIQKLRERIEKGNINQGSGSLKTQNATNSYINQIAGDIALSGNLKVVVDCANGIAGDIAPKLLEELGCEVIALHCTVDGSFPNHDPDPSVLSNLDDLVEKVKSEQADLGIALDGDGDRMVAVAANGEIILPDRLLMLFAKDIVSRNPGCDVIYDVKSTRSLNALISGYGGRPVMWKSGHSHIKSKMQETGALLGGELSGHIFFKERWLGFDDGLYAAARLLEIMTIRDQSLEQIMISLPVTSATPEIKVAIAEDKKFGFIQQLLANGDFGEAKIITMDGLRAEYINGWGLVRASNTSASLTLRFEADNDEALAEIMSRFRDQMARIDSSLKLHF